MQVKSQSQLKVLFHLINFSSLFKSKIELGWESFCLRIADMRVTCGSGIKLSRVTALPRCTKVSLSKQE